MRMKVKGRPADVFDDALLGEIAAVGHISEVRFRLREVKLADAQRHKLTRRLTVRVLWDEAVGYCVAVDGKTGFAGEGDTAADALRNYLAVWADDFQWLCEHEAELGKPLLEDLRSLRKLLGLSAANAH